MSKKLTLEEVLERVKQSYLEKEKRENERKMRSIAMLETDREQARAALIAMQNLSKKARRELKPVFARLRAFCAGVSYSEYIRRTATTARNALNAYQSAEEVTE